MHTPPLATIRQLHYFVATAQTGSATRAAALRNVSQPSVSVPIRERAVDLASRCFTAATPDGIHQRLQRRCLRGGQNGLVNQHLTNPGIAACSALKLRLIANPPSVPRISGRRTVCRGWRPTSSRWHR